MKMRIRTSSSGNYLVEHKRNFFSKWIIEYVCTSKQDAYTRFKSLKEELIRIREIEKMGVIYEETING